MIVINKGLTGILRPNGEFIECEYEKHYYVALKIPKEEELSCIYFSSNVYDIKDSLLFFSEDITKEQLKWFITNLDKLDKTQYEKWIEYINSKIYS